MNVGPRFWACRRCREKHKKCSGPPWPCEECRREGVPCERDKRRGARRRGPINAVMRELQSVHEVGLLGAGDSAVQGSAAPLLACDAFGCVWPFGGGHVLEVGMPGGGVPSVWPFLRYQSIQAAIDNASDGDTIFVYPGRYCERIDVHRSVRILAANPPPWLPHPTDGSASAAAPFDATAVPLEEMDGVAVLLPPSHEDAEKASGPTNTLVRFSAEAFCVFGGFAVVAGGSHGEPPSDGGSSAIVVERGRVHVSTCDIRNVRTSVTGNEDAVRVRGSFANPIFERCRVSAPCGGGVRVDDCGHTQIVSSAIVHCAAAGVFFAAASSASLSESGAEERKCTLRGCSVGRCAGVGAVVVGNAQLCVVEGNAFWENTQDIADASGRSLADHPILQQRNRFNLSFASVTSAPAGAALPIPNVSAATVAGTHSRPEQPGEGVQSSAPFLLPSLGAAPFSRAALHASAVLPFTEPMQAPETLAPFSTILRQSDASVLPMRRPRTGTALRPQPYSAPSRLLAFSGGGEGAAGAGADEEDAPPRRKQARLTERSAGDSMRILRASAPTVPELRVEHGTAPADASQPHTEVEALRCEVRWLRQRVKELEALLQQR